VFRTLVLRRELTPDIEVPDQYFVNKKTLTDFILSENLEIKDPEHPYHFYGIAIAYFVKQGVLPVSEQEIPLICGVGDYDYILPFKDGNFVNDEGVAFDLINALNDDLRYRNYPVFAKTPVRATYKEIEEAIGPVPESPIIRGRSLS